MMGRLIRHWIPFLFFILIPGLVVLFGYLMPGIAPLTELRDMMVEWAVIISAFAFLLGLLNVLQVHGRHIRRRRSGWFYSLILVLAMLLTWIPPAFQSLGLDFLGIPVSSEAQAMLATTSQWIFDYVITPLGASLAALLAFTLVLAALRIFRARLNAWAVIFLVTVVVVLLGSIPFTTGLEWLTGIRSWIIDVLSTAGIRGLLLGVALGVIVTALRVFIVSEQPYSES